MKMKVKSLMLGDLVYDSPFFQLLFCKATQVYDV